MVDNPPLPNPADCAVRASAFKPLNDLLSRRNPDCQVTLARLLEQTRAYRSMLLELRDRHPGKVTVFDPTTLLCDVQAGVCGPVHAGRMQYSYTDHISDYAAGRLGRALNDYLLGVDARPQPVLGVDGTAARMAAAR